MTFFEKLMSDFFDDAHITPQRLYNFGKYTLTQLNLFNTGGIYDTLIAELDNALKDLLADITGVDQGTGVQKNTTLSNDKAMALFISTMGEKKGAIADRVGGFDTDAFREFYPFKKSDYSVATKTTMDKLVQRVNKAATKYAAQLDTTLTALLQGFQEQWEKSRNIQETQIGVVEDSRIDTSPSRTAVSGKIKKTIGLLWTINENDDAQTAKYFDFSKLHNYTHHKHEVLSGSLTLSSLKVLSNEGFGDDQIIKGRNTSTNATYIIYIVQNAGDAPTLFLEVKPGKTFSTKAILLGDTANTMLVIKNISTVNETSYIIEIME